MKLVKIEDVRVGQIWIKEGLYAVITTVTNYLNNPIRFVFGNTYHKDNNLDCVGVNLNFVSSSLIGFLGITHEIKDNSLVEIQEKTKDKTIYFINDVVKYQDCEGNTFSAVINQKEVSPLYNYYVATNTLGCFVELSDNLEDQEGLEPNEYTYFPMEKIGILGVTHEFANERLVK